MGYPQRGISRFQGKCSTGSASCASSTCMHRRSLQPHVSCRTFASCTPSSCEAPPPPRSGRSLHEALGAALMPPTLCAALLRITMLRYAREECTWFWHNPGPVQLGPCLTQLTLTSVLVHPDDQVSPAGVALHGTLHEHVRSPASSDALRLRVLCSPPL